MGKTTRLTVSLDATVYEWVTRAAAAEGRSVSAVINEAVRRDLVRESLAHMPIVPEDDALTSAAAVAEQARFAYDEH
ncbi:CopG family transcriptional regulator [Nocardia sp. alder85J]|uniref:ribbon-helix-helix domain-containing protein n=1 Tax=Nocardia sp. alder85J TaxID=2862949 RepID=UPI001CD4146F|nr:CopG family transcriptional regulator [Nocardia sp. alder85J]MCX4091529.1 ribbon-helix-helix domain-containing protein [Nocardia sp. alder85J]